MSKMPIARNLELANQSNGGKDMADIKSEKSSAWYLKRAVPLAFAISAVAATPALADEATVQEPVDEIAPESIQAGSQGVEQITTTKPATANIPLPADYVAQRDAQTAQNGVGVEVSAAEADGSAVSGYDSASAAAPTDIIATEAVAKETLNASEDSTALSTLEATSNVVINEIQADGSPDWVEIYNPNDREIDISGWTIMDDDPAGHAGKATPLTQGTKIAAHGTFVFRGDRDFSFGLGNKGDTVTLRDADGNTVDQYRWTSKAGSGSTWQRVPDGTGEFKAGSASEGALNDPKNAPTENHLILNEIDSSPADWIEFYNNGTEEIDLTGYEIRDSNNDHRWRFADGTKLAAGAYYVVDNNTQGIQFNDSTGTWSDGTFNIGLGAGDSVRVYDAAGTLIQQDSWTEHASAGGDPANATIGRLPDASGDFAITKPTPGAANQKVEDVTPDKPTDLNAQPWPGDQNVTVVDKTSTFLEDSSGLDVDGNILWAVDNDHGTIWKMTLDKNGFPTMAEKWSNGKRINFQKDGKRADVAGPDSEGITVDGNHNIYLAVERDNAQKGVNYNVVVKVNADALESDDPILVADQEWNLTSLLPAVNANMGIEGIEWIANSELEGKIIDINTGKAYKSSDYANATAGGLFFVCLEDNGHVYAFALNGDGSATLIADIDAGMGGAMALDYNVETHTLWVAGDDGYDGHLATIQFNGTKTPKVTQSISKSAIDGVVYYNRPGEMPNLNNEGFAIASSEYGPEGKRPAYWFEDGVKSQALRMTYLDMPATPDKPDTPDTPDKPNTPVVTPSNPSNPTTPNTPSGSNTSGKASLVAQISTSPAHLASTSTKASSMPKTADKSPLVPFAATLAAGFAVIGAGLARKRGKHERR